MNPFRIFIGWDAKEPEAYHVLSHSIITRATSPVSIIPLVKKQIKEYTRPRSPLESTDFSLTRFMVPYLSDFEGFSLFMDCDMLVQTDITKLILDTVAYPDHAVHVVKHDYTPISPTKMMGMRQTAYPRKNWSSFMLFNNELCKVLTPGFVNSNLASTLQRFAWLPDSSIRGLAPEWNWLVGEYPVNPGAKVLHYTLGGPWHGDPEMQEPWLAERDAALPLHVEEDPIRPY